MKHTFLKTLSVLLVLILLANMLPLGVFAQQLQRKTGDGSVS